MTIVADENVPFAIVRRLRELGHDVTWIKIASPGLSDAEIFRSCEESGSVLITQDKDFGEIACLRLATRRSGVILLRFGSQPADTVASALALALTNHEEFLGWFTVVTATQVRRRPMRRM
ncbi:MAG: DUF5615 family PIN-like protein [Bryobacteraceae bacterium]|nr:DUF5615 family PIN-like protein [Bryobacteraceae bacterium]